MKHTLKLLLLLTPFAVTSCLEDTQKVKELYGTYQELSEKYEQTLAAKERLERELKTMTTILEAEKTAVRRIYTD